MNNIGIIVAMEEEMTAVKEIMDDITEKSFCGLSIYEGTIEKKRCILTKSGVGKVNAARATQIMIDHYAIEYLVNVGAAGALNPMLQIGDIVIGEKLVQHDFDITAFGHSKGYITGIGDKIQSDLQLVNQFEESMQIVDGGTYKIVKGIIASGDIFCTDISMKNKIYTKFDAECVEMEGAAIAQVCYLNQIPFVIIRSISDTPNGENAITFDQYLKLASERCAQFLRQAFKK